MMVGTPVTPATLAICSGLAAPIVIIVPMGTSRPPDSPCRARAAMSDSVDPASPHRSEASAKTARPAT